MPDNQMKAEFALNTQIQTQITTIPLALPNIPYTPSVTGEFIRVSHRPGIKRQATLGSTGLNRISGTMILYVSYPVNNENLGTYNANLTAGQLIALYERGKKLVYDGVTVTCERAQRTGALEGETRYTPIVEVAWYAYVPNETVV